MTERERQRLDRLGCIRDLDNLGRGEQAPAGAADESEGDDAVHARAQQHQQPAIAARWIAT
ncbi:hypothetical protein ACIO8G_34845 [Streptomyces sp. NPDC087219]|uniref:hypothetical protein n=1 Tax=Streptomyces sp. NPDC087219 TaxID=3365770 RepID=UPI0038277783